MKGLSRLDLSPKLLNVSPTILLHTFISLMFHFCSITSLLNFVPPSFNNQPSPG